MWHRRTNSNVIRYCQIKYLLAYLLFPLFTFTHSTRQPESGCTRHRLAHHWDVVTGELSEALCHTGDRDEARGELGWGGRVRASNPHHTPPFPVCCAQRTKSSPPHLTHHYPAHTVQPQGHFSSCLFHNEDVKQGVGSIFTLAAHPQINSSSSVPESAGEEAVCLC